MLQAAVEAEVGDYVAQHGDLRDPETGRRVVVRNGHQPERTIQSSLGENAGISFQSGAASGTFTGQLTKELIDLTIAVNLKDLQAQGQGDGVLGLGAKETSEVMGVLKELGTTIRVVGPVTEPRLVFDTKGLTEEFKQALVKAGKERIKDEIDSKIEEELGDKVPEELKDAIKKPGQGLIEGLGGLLGGKKKDE